MIEWSCILDFLKDGASGWVQAIGSILAITGAFKIGRAQIEADHAIENEKLRKSLVHRATVINSLANELKFYADAIRQSFQQNTTPVLRVLHYDDLIHDSAIAFKNISLFDCPSLTLINIISIIPRSAFAFHEELKDYNKSFDEYSNDYDEKSKLILERSSINIQNGAQVLLYSLDACIEECKLIISSNSEAKPT